MRTILLSSPSGIGQTTVLMDKETGEMIDDVQWVEFDLLTLDHMWTATLHSTSDPRIATIAEKVYIITP